MGRLIRSVGHDLRNKLAVMKNSIYYLNMKLGHGDEKVQKHLQIMRSEVVNANRIVMDLTDFALAKAAILQEANVKAIVMEALSQALLPGNVEVITDLAESLSLITADPNQLQRALSNIILNSIQAMPEGGELGITAREQAGFVEVGFSDTGPSTPEEGLEGIFDPLSATKEGRGNLGLAVSKRLVEGHGGTIKVRSLAGPFDKRRPEPFVPGPCTCRPWSFGPVLRPYRTKCPSPWSCGTVPYGPVRCPRTQGTKGPGQVPKDQGLVEGLRTGEGTTFTVRLPLLS